jgi:hypothetical protein
MHVRAVPTPSNYEPWFRERPYFTVAVSVVLFLGIFVPRLLFGSPRDAYSMLYVFPVALLATAFGRKVGALAGVVAVGLIVAWVLVDDVDLSPVGWVSRVLPLLLLGLLVGDATDRLARAEVERARLASAALLHREAIEINDSLIQGMSAAKWSFEAGRTEAGLKTLGDTIEQGHELVSGLIKDAGMGGRTESIRRE